MDTIANMLISLVNASRAGKQRVKVPHSRFSKALADFLQQKELVAQVKENSSHNVSALLITLAYDGDQARLRGVRRLSKPGQRFYVTKNKLPYGNHPQGMVIVSTPQGLMDSVSARQHGVGGELICEIW